MADDQSNMKQNLDFCYCAEGDNRLPSCSVSALMVAIAPEVVLALRVQVSFCWMR